MISNSDFEKVIDCLPEGFTWGSALTPDIALHIVNVAESSAIKQLEADLAAAKKFEAAFTRLYRVLCDDQLAQSCNLQSATYYQKLMIGAADAALRSKSGEPEMNNREAFEVMRRDKLEELLDEYFDLAVEKGRNFERNGLRSNQVRKEILSLFDLASQAQQTESQEASDTKNAERKNWTTKDWMSHVGAWETDRDTIEFGSIMAVNAMLIQFQQFMLWQIEQQEQKSLCEYKTLLSDIQGLINSSEGVAGLHKNGEVATWDWLINSEWLSLPPPEGEEK